MFEIKKHVHILLFFACLILGAVGTLFPAIRVGDGSEYYAMFQTWFVSHFPWMTQAAYDAYGQLALSGNIRNMVSQEYLENIYPELHLGITSDFNHFWFYSFLAAIFSKVFSLLNVNLTVHSAFLIVHSVLLSIVLSIAYIFFQKKGIVAVIILTFASPILWYFNKVHTEFFTHCTVLSAIILVYARYYMSGAFFLALASTQNISFAVLAFILFMYRIIQWHKAYSLYEVCITIATVITVLIHPIYYLSRFGVPTPQIFAGGAKIGSNFSYWYVWLFDPDLGLLTHWPLGLIILFTAFLLYFKSKKIITYFSVDYHIVFFIVFYIIFNLFVQSSTTNLNSAACRSVQRYALWYIPLFFPAMYYISYNLAGTKILRTLFWGLFSIVTLVNSIYFSPHYDEDFLSSTRLSRLIQKYFSHYYNPPWQVFMARYHNSVVDSLCCIIGPDHRKILIFPNQTNQSIVDTGGLAFVDRDKLKNLAQKLSKNKKEPFYTFLTDAQLSEILLTVPLNQKIPVGLTHFGNFIFEKGWSTHEEWGCWSVRDNVILQLPYNSNQPYFSKKFIIVTLNFDTFGEQTVTAQIGSYQLAKEIYNGSSEMILKIPVSEAKDGRFTIELDISNPHSPKNLGTGDDPRDLGIGLKSFSVRLAEE